MPVLSTFYGIVVYINFRDHSPPHFHVRYGDDEVSVEIHTGKVKGEMSKRALQMVFEWMDIHKLELINAWNNAEKSQTINKIDPLP